MSLGIRILKDRLMKVVIVLLAFATLLPLILLLFTIVKNGIGVVNLKFLISLPKPPGEAGGGILNSIVGTLMLITIASVISVPFGILVGIFLAEVRNRFTELLRLLVNVLQGIPSIVIGIVAYFLVVKPLGGFSALSGGVALGLMMLPMVIKNTEESLKLVPFYLKEASFSLGVNYTRTIWKVVLPTGIGGVLSGILVGLLRITGETAPLLLTAFGNPFLNLNPLKPVDALPLLIFNYAMSPYQDWHRIAWGASFVLITIVFVLTLIARGINQIWKTRF